MKTFSWRKFSAAVLSAAALSVVGVVAQRGGPAGPQQASALEPLKFRYMGPAAAGRIASVAGVPGDPTTYYLGSASGGVWKSTDSGTTFVPISDDIPVAAIGSIAVANSDPNTVWIGTGEPWLIRYSDVMGDGVYVSKDAGKTWQHKGLAETGRIARVLIHPADPNVIYVCATGRVTGPQEERGVFKSTDGGGTWTRSLFVDRDTGCSGLSMDAKDPNILLAGTWTVEQHTWGQFSGGLGSGVFMTKDGGAKWTRLTKGLPTPPVGKIDVQIAPSDSNRMYALIQTGSEGVKGLKSQAQGSVWRSDDAGATWRVVSWDRSLIGRAGYYIRMVVNPQNPDDIFIMSSSMHRSQDGGKTFSGNGAQQAFPFTQGQASCGDCHDVWIDPKDPKRYITVDDLGATINTPNGPQGIRIPNGQMYHVHVDNRVPYWIYSNRQDDGTMRGPSTASEVTANGCLPENSTMPVSAGGRGRGGRGRGAPAPPANPACTGTGRGTTPPATAWQPNLGGCESGFTMPDPSNADIVYGSCYGNKVTRWDAKRGTARSIQPWMVSLDSPPNEQKYRCHWTSPLAIDPFDPKNVLYGCQLILKTTNGGQSWTEASPDLSTKDTSRIVSNGGIAGDNLGQYNGAVVWSIEYSKIKQDLIWAGTNDGKFWVSKDGGAAWTDLTKNFTDLPHWGAFNQIWPSTFDPNEVYVAVSAHLMDDRKPYIYKSIDSGTTWKRITGNIPTGHNLDYVLSMSGNPNRKGMLFAGTGRAFYYSMDDGGTWTRFKEGLPPAPVSWITVEPRFHDVVLSTYGRGLYILPNITIFEQTGQATPPSANVTKLFDPAPIFRQARNVFVQANRPHFQLMLATAPQGPIKMEILDTENKVIRTQMITGRAGMNGINWDLLLDAPKLVELLTTPPDNPHIWEEARFKDVQIRRITHWGITPQTGIPMAAPGKYQARFTVDGNAMTAPFEVLKDPAVETSVEDLQISTRTQMRVRDDLTLTSTLVNKMEVWRRQIEDQIKLNAKKPAVVASLTKLDQQIWEVENKLVSKAEIHSDDKWFPEAYKVYMNLIWLSGGVGQGASDEAGSIDYKPTDTQMQVLEFIEKELASAKEGFDRIEKTVLPAFNKAMTGKVPEIK